MEICRTTPRPRPLFHRRQALPFRLRYPFPFSSLLFNLGFYSTLALALNSDVSNAKFLSFLFRIKLRIVCFEDVSGVHDFASYYPHDDDRGGGGGLRVIRDTESLEASYERYLRSAVLLIFHVLKCLIISAPFIYGPNWHVHVIATLIRDTLYVLFTSSCV